MKSRSFFKCRSYIIVTASFLAGGALYTFFRESEPLFFKFYKLAGMEGALNRIRHHTLRYSSSLPEWFVYSLPDAIWSFAYAFLITIIWWRRSSIFKYFWLASVPIVIGGLEVLQIKGIFPGTFTLSDLLFELAGMILGLITGINQLKTKYYEKSSTQINNPT